MNSELKNMVHKVDNLLILKNLSRINFTDHTTFELSFF
jgi:hypothetical protein